MIWSALVVEWLQCTTSVVQIWQETLIARCTHFCKKHYRSKNFLTGSFWEWILLLFSFCSQSAFLPHCTTKWLVQQRAVNSLRTFLSCSDVGWTFCWVKVTGFFFYRFLWGQFCLYLTVAGIEAHSKQVERERNDLQHRSFTRIKPETLPLCDMCLNHSTSKALQHLLCDMFDAWTVLSWNHMLCCRWGMYMC